MTFEHRSLSEALQYINPNVHLWSRTTARNTATEIFDSMFSQVKDDLSKMDCMISLTTDLWTSLADVPYIAVTGHYITDDWTLKKIVLDISNIRHPHGAIEIAASIVEVLNKFGITQKILCCTHDNARNQIKAMQILKPSLSALFFDRRCAAHILDLVVKDGLAPINAEVEKIRDFVIALKRSTKMKQDFKDISSAVNPNCRNIPADVSTRWNSVFLMLDVACEV